MMRSMFAGVSGLRNHQVRMDVIGNNIANVNTVAYKTSRVTFRQLFSQTIRGASAPTAGRGGTNPLQVGLGMTLGSIDVNHEPGNLQPTGITTDMAIQGQGFFVVNNGGSNLFTRAGAFGLDEQGYLVDPVTGMRVQGWLATAGVFGAKDANTLTDVRIPIGTQISPEPTTALEWILNLDSAATAGETFSTRADMFDSLGERHTVTFTFTKTATPNEWDWDTDWGGGSVGSGTITFDTNGLVLAGATGNVTFNPPGAAAMNVTVDFTGITQFSGESVVGSYFIDGFPTGSLERYTVDQSGVITGSFSNGVSLDLAQVALASFANPAGLLNQSDNYYDVSNNSGPAQIGQPGTGSLGRLAPGSLEMSNVDLSQEFTDMIITQRGFQANSRIITASDEMLQELVNLKR